jgi:hypothetical protein
MRERAISANSVILGQAVEDTREGIIIKDSRHWRSFWGAFSHFPSDESTSEHQYSSLANRS